MSVRFLHLADCHLGAAHRDLGDRADARRDEIKASFRAALEWAMDPQHAIDGVLIAGDLFDGRRPDSDTLALVRGLFARLVASKRCVVLLPGCHDGFAYPDSVFRSERLPGVDVLSAATPGAPVVREINGTPVHFYGVAHVPGRSPDAFPGFERTAADGLHVGLLHGMVPGHAEENVRPHAWKLPLPAIERSGLDYVAMGGSHQHGAYRFAAGRAAASCGALEGVTFMPGDLGRKSLLVVTFADGAVTLDAMPWSRKTLVDETLDLDRESIRSVESLRDAMMARAGADVIARFTLIGSREFNWDRDAFVAEMQNRFSHVRLVDRSSFENSALLRRIASESTIRGFFVRRMIEKLDRLRTEAASPNASRDIDRRIAVAERALTIGIEPFLETDAATPEGVCTPESAAAGVTVVALRNGSSKGVLAAALAAEAAAPEGRLS